jgi:hypothetical protein
MCRDPDDIIVRGAIDLTSPIYPVTNLLFSNFFGVSAELVFCDVEKKVTEEGSSEKVGTVRHFPDRSPSWVAGYLVRN